MSCDSYIKPVLWQGHFWCVYSCLCMHACACIDFMDTRDYRLRCSIQIVCISTVHSISKCFTEFLKFQQVTTLFSDTTEGTHRDLWKDYESYSVVWNLAFTLLTCQFLLSCYDHWRFLNWTFFAWMFWLRKFSFRYLVTAL